MRTTRSPPSPPCCTTAKITQEQLNAVQDEVRTEIREAVRFGTQGEEPTIEAMMTGIYAPSPVDARDLAARA